MRTPDKKDIDDILSDKFVKFRLKQLKPLDTEHKRTQFFKNITKKRPTINDIKPLRKLIEKGKCTGAILEHKHSFTWVHKNGLTNAKEKVYKCLKKGEVNQSRSIVLFRKPEGKSEKLQFIIRRITKGCYVDTGEEIDEYYKVYWVKFNIRFHLFEDYPNKKVRDKLMQFKDKFMKGTMSDEETDSESNEEQSSDLTNSSNIGKNSRKNKITTSSGAGENSNNELVASTSGVKTRNASKLMTNLQRPEQDNIKEAIVDGNQNKFEDEEATDEIVKGNDKVEEQEDDFNAEEEDDEDEDEDEDDEDEDEDDEDDDEELTEEDNKKMKDYFARIFIVNWINKNIPLCYNQNYNAARLMQKLCNEFGLDSVNKSNFDSDWFHIEQGDIQALFDQSRESLSKRLREQYVLALSVVHCNVPDKQNFYLAIVSKIDTKKFTLSPIEFWWKNQRIYKKLSSIAYFYLSIPASCFPSEVMLVNAARNAKSILEDYSDDYSREQIISLIINKEFLREYFN